MPLTGDAKTAYQREYMRRRRAEQRKSELGGQPGTRWVLPLKFSCTEEKKLEGALFVVTNEFAKLWASPQTEEERDRAWRLSILFGYWMSQASDEAMQLLFDELNADRKRWDAEEAAAESEKA